MAGEVQPDKRAELNCLLDQLDRLVDRCGWEKETGWDETVEEIEYRRLYAKLVARVDVLTKELGI